MKTTIFCKFEVIKDGIFSFMKQINKFKIMGKNQISFFVIVVSFLVHINGFSQTDFNKLDEKGRKHGVWRGFFEESKRPRYEGTFEHGKEVGIFNYYDDTKAKSVIATREFGIKSQEAYTIFYDQKGNKVSEGNVINKLFEGKWTYYHEASKNIMATEFYIKGKLEGLRSVYYASGKIAEEINYKNNLKNGSYKKFAENGTLLEESNYSNDQYNGLSIFRDALGNVVSKGMFVNGKKSGMWQFFEKGKLVKEMNMSLQQNAKQAKSN